VIGPYLIACGLLLLAGAIKAFRPADTVRALGEVFAHARLLAVAVPLLAAGEFTLGAAGIIWPIPGLATAVAISYIVFAGFVIAIRLRHGALSSCGCFGTPDTPATWLHAVINLFLAASSLVIAVNPPGGNIAHILSGQPLHGVPLILAVLVGMSLVYLAFTRLALLDALHGALAANVEGSSR
jgi:Methylamine utilisation protein MauE